MILDTDEYLRSSSNVVITETGEPALREEWDFEPIIDDEIVDEDDLARKRANLIGVSPSQFVEFAVRVPDKVLKKHIPFSFSGREYLRIPYDTDARRTLFKCGRQVEKSTFLGNKSLAYACINNAFNILYVSPTNQQTKVFSQDRLKEPVETSDILRAWTTTKLSDNVFLKKFINRSQITLRYAYHNADRTRGIPADLVLIDELQDVITDNIPVIEECASHSAYKLFMYSGTPKSFDNAIEHYWSEFSTQNEWVIPCDRHGVPKDPSTWHWNMLGEDNIGKDGLVCDRCKQPIMAMRPESQWASMNPSVRRPANEGGLGDKAYEGFRIPQLMVPWLDWSEILVKVQTYPRSQLYNEVLGLSYDSGTRPLTRQDVIDNCLPGLFMTEARLAEIRHLLGDSNPVFCGIDWGCHDDQTRILTENRGFVYFKDLTDNDRVAQWDPDTREMTFTHPQVRTVRDWNKPLYHFEGKGLDMMLTHTHRMRVGARSGSKRIWKTESCEKTITRSNSVMFTGFINWTGEEQEWFILPPKDISPGYPGSDTKYFKMNDWLRFLGYYLSEGGLCFNEGRPSCLKLSQRETVNPRTTKLIRSLLWQLFPDNVSEFPNKKTGDVNWTLYGKQLWSWVSDNIGNYGHLKRIPRQFMNLSKYQLSILFDAMMLGDGTVDTRLGTHNGAYYSTSKGLCEDFQELCIKLGLRSTLNLHKKADGNRKTGWRVSWSAGRDFQYNNPNQTKTVLYDGKVYCCKVPTGYIVTERNGRIAYQGNTGEGSFSVLSLGAYLYPGLFTIFYIHRFEGQYTEPQVQLDFIDNVIRRWNVLLVGTDYGGGFDRNDHLQRKFGTDRIVKYQYSQPGQKISWQPELKRFLVHRTEVMSDIFNAIKRRNCFRFPDWQHFEDPFGKDFLNIFSEYNEQQRQIQYKKSPDATDDSFHSVLLCFLACLLKIPRYDILNPTQKTGVASDD